MHELFKQERPASDTAGTGEASTAGEDRAELEYLRAELDRSNAELIQVTKDLVQIQATLATIRQGVPPLLLKWINRTAQVRTVARRLRGLRLRALCRIAAKFAWWTVSLQLRARLRERIGVLVADAQVVPRPDPAPPSALAGAPRPPPIAAQLPRTAHRSRADGELRIVYISGEPSTPGHRYRVLRPAAAAAALGAHVVVMSSDEVGVRISEIRAAHIMIIWRTPMEEGLEVAVRLARRSGVRIIFDVDDLMVRPDLARTEIIDGIRSQYLTEPGVAGHYTRIRNTMLVADLCVASTEELAQQMRRANMPALVLPNGFDDAVFTTSRLAVRRRRAVPPDDRLVRLGYASGSRTHQKDFAVCADAVCAVLRARPECRLVLFRTVDGTPLLDIEEFPALSGLEQQIEWRHLVELEQLPNELARFDVCLAPLEVGNPFCEAKSELKFFEAALVEVVTLASPTGPIRRAIRDGETGFLAAAPDEWKTTLMRLVDDAALRSRIASAAYLAVLWQYSPERRVEIMSDTLALVRGGRAAMAGFQREIERRQGPPAALPKVPDHEIVILFDRLAPSKVTVAVPLYNYAGYVAEALDSVSGQTLPDLDLVIVDDSSTDSSLAVAVKWAEAHAARFNRIVVAAKRANSGLALTRNVGFALAETPFVLPLDADNRLLPDCAAACLAAIEATGAAFAYPLIRDFGGTDGLRGEFDYDPIRLANSNYIDAMALVSRSAWAAIGGYDHIEYGWEDYDFWCRLARRGLYGAQVPGGPLAEYRVHSRSMTALAIARPEVYLAMSEAVKRRHPWLTPIW
jgi:glycosyltransferase involved in cell wall biosynthesis